MKGIKANTVFSIYLLYPINRDDEENFYKLLQEYINVGTEIFAYLIDWEKMDYIDDNTPFPKCRLYVPADHEVFIHSAYKSGFITKEQITSINYKIIETCDLLIVYDGQVLDIEEDIIHAKQEGIPIYTMPDLSRMAIDALKLAIKLIIRSED